MNSESDTKKPGAALAAMRVVTSKYCHHCGNEVKGIRIKKYCDESCKQAAKYQRKKIGKKSRNGATIND
jgi:hypothetical protein